jgi:hypothetical protein
MEAVQPSRRESWLRRLARLRPAAAITALVMVLVYVMSVIGIDTALDARARRFFYDMRGRRPPSASVLFVAIDQDTAHEWGGGPWTWERYDALIGKILAGNPELIAVLEPGPRVIAEAGELPPDLVAAIDDGRLLMPVPTFGFGQPRVSLDASGVVEAVDLGSASALEGPTITAEIVRRLGGRPATGRLGVNFIGPPDALPTLPAHHVARGEVPAKTFEGRVVVIGMRGERFTANVPTPVGPMSPAEVHAHALHGLVEHVTWRRLPFGVEVGLVLFCAGAAVIGLRRARSPILATITLIAVALLVVTLAYWLFARHAIELGVAAPLSALALGAVGGLLLERHDAQRDVTELRRTVARRIGAQRDEDLAAPHDRFVDALRSYFTVESTVWAELPPGRWHLDLAGWWGAGPDAVLERRRDVRRDPWRQPYASHRPEWSNRAFLKDDSQKTLIVPLVAFGRLHGFWILNVKKDVQISDAQLRLLTALTNQLALERERRLTRPEAEGGGVALGSTLVDAVHAVHNESLRLGQIHDRHLAVLEHLPVGVLVASLWGQVEYSNQAMRRFLVGAGMDTPDDLGLVELLQRLTGVDAGAVRDVVRELASGGAAVRLEARVADAVQAQRYELVLARVRFPQAGSEPDEHAPTSLVLTAASRAERDVAAVDWRWAAVEGGSHARHVVDVAQLVRDTAAQLAAAGHASGPPDIEITAESAVVVASGAELGDAVRAILAEAMRDAPTGARLIVEDDHDVVTVRVVIPTILPAADVQAVRSRRAETAPEHLAALIRARDQVTANHGRVEIDSSLDEGTSVRVQLPKPGRD